LFKTFWYFYKFIEAIFLEYTPTKSMVLLKTSLWSISCWCIHLSSSLSHPCEI
jgi:hypothetical protein